MCQVFISADPALYTCRARSVRLHGVATYRRRLSSVVLS